MKIFLQYNKNIVSIELNWEEPCAKLFEIAGKQFNIDQNKITIMFHQKVIEKHQYCDFDENDVLDVIITNNDSQTTITNNTITTDEDLPYPYTHFLLKEQPKAKNLIASIHITRSQANRAKYIQQWPALYQELMSEQEETLNQFPNLRIQLSNADKTRILLINAIQAWDASLFPLFQHQSGVPITDLISELKLFAPFIQKFRQIQMMTGIKAQIEFFSQDDETLRKSLQDRLLQHVRQHIFIIDEDELVSKVKNKFIPSPIAYQQQYTTEQILCAQDENVWRQSQNQVEKRADACQQTISEQVLEQLVGLFQDMSQFSQFDLQISIETVISGNWLVSHLNVVGILNLLNEYLQRHGKAPIVGNQVNVSSNKLFQYQDQLNQLLELELGQPEELLRNLLIEHEGDFQAVVRKLLE